MISSDWGIFQWILQWLYTGDLLCPDINLFDNVIAEARRLHVRVRAVIVGWRVVQIEVKMGLSSYLMLRNSFSSRFQLLQLCVAQIHLI